MGAGRRHGRLRRPSHDDLARLLRYRLKKVQCEIVKPDGSIVPFECDHTFSPEQVEWFKAGSALNIIRQKSQG